MAYDNRIQSGLIGFVVGDAMGVPTEFMDRDELKLNPVTEMIGYGAHEMPPGSWSDDSSMVLATIDSIVAEEHIDYTSLMKHFINWTAGDYTPSGYMFDIGKSTKESIIRYSKLNDISDCGGKSIYDNGNGSLMRILPIAYYAYYKKMADDELTIMINKVSSLTHAHEISILGCYIYVKYVMFILNGNDPKEAYKSLSKLNLEHFNHDSISQYSRILEYDIGKFHLDDIKSTGYIVDTLEAVFWCILNHSIIVILLLRQLILAEIRIQFRQ